MIILRESAHPARLRSAAVPAAICARFRAARRQRSAALARMPRWGAAETSNLQRRSAAAPYRHDHRGVRTEECLSRGESGSHAYGERSAGGTPAREAIASRQVFSPFVRPGSPAVLRTAKQSSVINALHALTSALARGGDS
jgi:hypothetical protein